MLNLIVYLVKNWKKLATTRREHGKLFPVHRTPYRKKVNTRLIDEMMSKSRSQVLTEKVKSKT